VIYAKRNAYGSQRNNPVKVIPSLLSGFLFAAYSGELLLTPTARPKQKMKNSSPCNSSRSAYLSHDFTTRARSYWHPDLKQSIVPPDRIYTTTNRCQSGSYSSLFFEKTHKHVIDQKFDVG